MWVWLSVGNLAHILHCRHEDMRMRSASVLRNRDRFLLLSYDGRGLGGVVLYRWDKSSVIGSLEPTKILPAPLFVVVFNALAGNDGGYLLSEKPFGRRLISTRFTMRRA